jgi:hypothetical protein
MKKQFYLLAAIVALVLAALACGTSNTGSAVSTAAPGAQAATSAPAQVQTYNVGDVVAVQDHTITLNSATIQGGKLTANFTIENKGTADLDVSSMLSFSAKDNDGTKLEADYTCADLNGKILAGDKLKGNICWTVTTATPFKIYYDASMFGSGSIVWLVK